MDSLKSLEQIYTIAIWLLTSIFLGFLTYRIYSVFIKKKSRHPLLRADNAWYPKLLKVLFGTSMLLTIIYVPFYAYIGSAFKSIIPSFLNNLLVITTLLLAALELFLAFSISEKIIQKPFKKIILTIVVLITLPLSIYLTAYVPEMFAYPTKDECFTMEMPVSGRWMVGHAGGSEIVNYHFAVKAQMYAMDIVKIDDGGKFFTGAGGQLSDFYTMGENIYSPADGTIINVVDSLPNAAISLLPSGTANPAGNHVVIEFEPNRYIFLAHLDKGTVLFNKGDQISAGDLIAKAGNSGNTSWPHLHMHIQDKPVIDNETATGFPYRFNILKRKRWLTWATVSNGFLIRNDIFQGRIES